MILPKDPSSLSSRIRRHLVPMIMAIALVCAGLVTVAPTAHAAPGPVHVTGLQTNGRTDPLGIDGEPPTFRWKSESADRNVNQRAYEIRVATSPANLANPDVWSSGKTDSADQLNIVYGGPALKSQTRYHWQVKVWTLDGSESEWSAPAWFETAILSAAEWDAQWIGGVDPATKFAKWDDYTATVDFRIDSLVMGLTAHATDINNLYMMQISIASGTPKFRPHKRVDGNWSLLGEIDLSSVVSKESLLTDRHSLAVTFDGSTIVSVLDGTEIDRRTDSALPRGYVGFRQFPADEGPENATIFAVSVTSPTHGTLLDTDFSDGLNPFSGGTITPEGLRVHAPNEIIYAAEQSNPLLRKDFTVDKTVTSARVYAASRGVYQLSLNGSRVGNAELAPGWTEYTKRIDFQTYDVTDLVTSGSNVIGAMLADGWYSGYVASFGSGLWGKENSLIAKLRLDYSDGTQAWIDTDPTWKTAPGPFVEADIFMGESFDARLDPQGWQEPGFSASGWSTVGVLDDTATALLEPQSDEPVRVTERRRAQSVTEAEPQTWIYDMGQNMVGVAEMDLTGLAGSTARIRYGEMLNPDGTLYTANLRTAKVTDYYTFASDGTATYTPKFTFHGFRYLEITGVTTAPSISEVTGMVWGSDLPMTGTLETSSAMLNQLQSNIVWGQRGNFLSIPTDTPARDERLGWTGDINVFAPTASYNQDTLAFLGKWLVDLRDTQRGDGSIPGIAPEIPGVDFGIGTGWSDAAVTVPYVLWHTYGDTAIIDENYEMMTRFMGHIESSTGPNLIRSSGWWADWLNLDDPTDATLLGTAYYAYVAGLMSEMAGVMGKTADAERYADLSKRVKQAFVDRFISADGTVSGNSQAGYAMSIGMGLVPESLLVKVGEKYVATIVRNDYHLSTGFLGTPWLLPALTATGNKDIAYRLINTETYPSWGYEVVSGATTMWERWDSLRPDGSFGDVNMNSFNHYAYGAVGQWMYENIGGITAMSAGYKTFRVAPSIGGGLTHGTGSFESVYGTIVSDWRTTSAGVDLTVSVPVNTSATVEIPAASRWAVTESGKSLEEQGLTVVSEANGVVTIAVGSGTYSLSSDPAHSGVIVAIVASDETLPGDTAEAALAVTNPGQGEVTDLVAVLTGPSGLSAKPLTVSIESLAPGETTSVPITVVIPATYVPGEVSFHADVTARVAGASRTFAFESHVVTVIAAITIDPMTVSIEPGDVPEVATLEITAKNRANVAIPGAFEVDVPEGWQEPLATDEMTVRAGEPATVTLDVPLPLSFDQGPQALTARFVAAEATIASATTTLTMDLVTPPLTPSDHVDLGEAVSEAAHSVAATAGGTSVEAGLTRRYSGQSAGAQFSFDMAVTPGQPFVIRGIETYDKPQTKGYDILVNGELITQRLVHKSGEGLVTYQVLVPDDGTLTATGTVTITMRHNGRGDHDPSLADVWTIPVAQDTIAPSVKLRTSKPGANGWYLAGATTTIRAVDGRSGVASIEYHSGDGVWADYTNPIALPEDATELSYRAADNAGNSSDTRTETLRVDSHAPAMWGWLSNDSRVFSVAQDGGSGPEAVAYSSGGDLWGGLETIPATRATPGDMVVRSSDTAGNMSDEVPLNGSASAPMLTVRPGHRAIVEANGFTPAAEVRVELHADKVYLLDTTVADSTGVLSVRTTMPAELPAGDCALVFVVLGNGGEPGKPGDPGTSDPGAPSISIPAQVIAVTGFEPLPGIAIGAMLLLGGVGLLVVRRRVHGGS